MSRNAVIVLRHASAFGMLLIFFLVTKVSPESIKWTIIFAYLMGRYYLPYGSGIEPRKGK